MFSSRWTAIALIALVLPGCRGGHDAELCKAVLDRPLLHSGGKLLFSLQSSWPSGHTIRAVLLASIVAVTWPAATRWAEHEAATA